MTSPTLVGALGAVATYAADHPEQVEHLVRSLGELLGIVREGGVPLVSVAPQPFDAIAEMRAAEATRVLVPAPVPTEKEPV